MSLSLNSHLMIQIMIMTAEFLFYNEWVKPRLPFARKCNRNGKQKIYALPILSFPAQQNCNKIHSWKCWTFFVSAGVFHVRQPIQFVYVQIDRNVNIMALRGDMDRFIMEFASYNLLYDKSSKEYKNTEMKKVWELIRKV